MTAEALLNLMYDGRGAIEPYLWRQRAIEEKIRERGLLNSFLYLLFFISVILILIYCGWINPCFNFSNSFFRLEIKHINNFEITHA